MPQQPKKATYKRGFKKWSDNQSAELRKSLGLNPYSPLCAFELCKYLKIPVWLPEDIPGMDQTQLDELLNNSSSLWSAFSLCNSEDVNIIVHNPVHAPARQQSNLMHEIAHIVCKHTVPKDKLNLGLGGFLRNYDEDQENEAIWLGACLQLSRESLLWALKRNMNTDNIAEFFNASPEMVKFRINTSGVKRQLAYMGF